MVIASNKRDLRMGNIAIFDMTFIKNSPELLIPDYSTNNYEF